MGPPTSSGIREGFPKQRLVVVPANVSHRCRVLPLVRQLHVTDIGSYPSAPGHFVGRERGAPQAILIYCLAGAGTLVLRNELFSVNRGVLFVIPPDVPHTYSADPDDPWSIFWVHFRGEQTDATLTSLGVSESSPLMHVPDVRRMRAAFEDVYACINYHYSDAGLLSMSAQLLRLISEIKLHRGQPIGQPGRQLAEDRVSETIGFMQDHLHLALRLEDLAAHAGRSVSHYSKVFKELTGQAPMAYFAQLKTRKACELLDETSMSVAEIAGELGYTDPFYFSRHFKRVQGCSPTAYRAAVKS